MRLLFVWPSAEWSTRDVAAGLLPALRRLGHEVREYRLENRIKFAAVAFEASGLPDQAKNIELCARLAAEAMLAEAIYHDAEWVLAVSGLALHPIGPLQCRRAGIPTAIVHTESPYEDGDQAELSGHFDASFTNDAASAQRYGWTHLPHAFDPAIHRPVEPGDAPAGLLEQAGIGPEGVDVLILGTGWPERIRLLEAIDWTGIRLRIVGLWNLPAGSPLAPFYVQGLVDNAAVPYLYASARVCLNFHRAADGADSLNPRARELAACGAFQVSDGRPELRRVFGSTVPTFDGPRELEALIRRHLADPGLRAGLAAKQRQAVLEGWPGNTFDHRAAALAAVLRSHPARRPEPAAASASGG